MSPTYTPVLYSDPIESRAARYREALAREPNTSASLYFTEQEQRYMQAAGANAAGQGSFAEEVKKQFPTIAPYLGVPELANILKKAVDEGWPVGQTLSNLQATDWWRQRTEKQRQWFVLNQVDPEGARKSLFDQYTEIERTASHLGINPGSPFIMDLASRTLGSGLDNEQIMDLLSNWAYDNNQVSSGQLGATRDMLKKTAAEFAIPVSDDGLRTWTRNVVSGRADSETFETYMRDLAKTQYVDPTLHKALDAGMTVREFADPYVQKAADTLGVNPQSISLYEDKWNAALNYQAPDGTRRVQTLDEWGRNLRSKTEYGYDYTDKAKNQAAGFVDDLAKLFGKA